MVAVDTEVGLRGGVAEPDRRTLADPEPAAGHPDGPAGGWGPGRQGSVRRDRRRVRLALPAPRAAAPTSWARRHVAPLLVAVAAIAGWTIASDHVLRPDKRFLLPSPLQVLRVGLFDHVNRTEILHGLWSTGQVAVIGLLVSMLIGVGLAIAMSQARWVEHSLYPYAVILQTIPILAVVPLIGYWFGFAFRSRVLVCVLFAVFPIITNTLFGLKSADASLHDLFSLHRASRGTRLWKLQLPTALPAMVEGFRISAGLSVIGAIVADFFFRQGNPGIGRLIDVYRQKLATEQLITAVLVSSLLGIVLFWIFGWAGRQVQRSRQPRGRRRAL